PMRKIAAAITIGAMGLLIAAGVYFLGWGLLLTGDWVSALELLLVINPHFKLGIDRSYADFVQDISAQAWVGLIFGGWALVWLWLAGRCRKPTVSLAIVAILGLWGELTLYGFHKNIRRNDRGFPNAITPLHALIDTNVEGRLHTLVPGPWEKNTGEASGIPMTTGYNPMILRWVDHLFPPEEPTFGRKSQENLLDLWNVSHVAAPGHRCTVALPGGGRYVELTTGTGVVYLARRSAELREKAEFIAAGAPLSRLAIVSAAMGVAGEAQGTTVGVVTLLGVHGEQLTTYPLRLGYETAEWKYDNPELSAALRHQAPMRAFVSRNSIETSITTYFLAQFEVATTEPVARILVETLLDAPRWLATSHVIEETRDGDAVVHPAIESLGYKAQLSRNPSLWIYFRRPTAPGWAWMVPEGKPVSYKKDFCWVRQRVMDPHWDYRRVVWLDKADFRTTEALTSSNAAAPESFKASVKVHHPLPEFWLLHTEANDRGWLFLSKTWYPGWRATLDGRIVKIVRANGPFSAVAVPAGNHVIKFEYATPWFWVGAPISGTIWLVASIGLIFGRRRGCGLGP
ncbi:MAG: YfhO family protein, partial [Candidatus Sumerlaeaceae bacterium]|nr:YfhO family protein [Candidatus Sumerlaeaceae bacterium]